MEEKTYRIEDDKYSSLQKSHSLCQGDLWQWRPRRIFCVSIFFCILFAIKQWQTKSKISWFSGMLECCGLGNIDIFCLLLWMLVLSSKLFPSVLIVTHVHNWWRTWFSREFLFQSCKKYSTRCTVILLSNFIPWRNHWMCSHYLAWILWIQCNTQNNKSINQSLYVTKGFKP